MAFPETATLDDFERVEDPLSTNWASDPFSWNDPGGLAADGSYAVSVFDGAHRERGSYRTDGPFSAPCEVWAEFSRAPGSGFYCDLYLCLQQPGTGGEDGYGLFIQNASGTLQLRVFRVDNDTWTQLGATIGLPSFGDGRAIGASLAADGTIELWEGPLGSMVSLGTRSDSTYTSGTVGGTIMGTGSAWESFGGGEVSAPPPQTIPGAQSTETDAAQQGSVSAGAVTVTGSQASETDVATAGALTSTPAAPPPAVIRPYEGDRFTAALARAHRIVSRVTVLPANGDPFELPGLIDGSVTLDAGAAIRRRCDLTITDDGTPGNIARTVHDALAPTGVEVKIERGIRYPNGDVELYPLGVFGVQRVSANDSGSEVEIAVYGLDRAKRVIDGRFEAPYTVPAGTLYTDAILDLVTPNVPNLSYDFPTVSTTTPLLTAEEQGDRWDFAQRMAASLGMELFFDGDGVLVLRPVPSGGAAVWTIAESTSPGDGGVLLSAGSVRDREGSYNRWIVTGENLGEDAPPARGVATDDDPASPTYYYGPFGPVPKFYVSEFITSDAQAADAAAGFKAAEIGTSYSVEFGAIVNPRLADGDVVRITRARLGVDEDHIIDMLTIPLGHAEPMTGATRTVLQ